MVALFREDDIAAAACCSGWRGSTTRASCSTSCWWSRRKTPLTRAVLARIRSAPLDAGDRGARRPDPHQTARAQLSRSNFAAARIVGVYDAEDAPDPDQIRKVVRPLSRAWRRGGLPAGRARLSTTRAPTGWRAALPSNTPRGFAPCCRASHGWGWSCRWAAPRCSSAARRSRTLGGWDAHNVTEDADLGIRLARHGYRTELIDTVTHEEANCRVLPWVQATLALDQGLHDDLGRAICATRCLLWRQLGAVAVRRAFRCCSSARSRSSCSRRCCGAVCWLARWALATRSRAGLAHAGIAAMTVLLLLSEALTIGVRPGRCVRANTATCWPVGCRCCIVYFPLGRAGGLQGAVGSGGAALLLGQDQPRPFRP